ncbi:MAG TPA: T9SS type A sorting domain-containing protein [Bacteroidales bacterium]|nr:T9SS type A sorting domain-containing protein [Bacteroidales bacterium]
MTQFLRNILVITVFAFFMLLTKANTAVVSTIPSYSEINVFSNPEEESKFKLYISEGILNIKYDKPNELLNGEVYIYNLLGQEVSRKKLETIEINQISMPTQNTCYIVRINYSGKVYTQKIIVNGN